MTAALVGLGWLDLVATCVLAGGVLFAALGAPPAATGRRVLGAAAVIAALALAGSVVAVGDRLHAFAGVGGLRLARDMTAMQWGRLWAARAIGLVLVGAGVAARRPRWAALGVLVVPWLFVRSFQGHAGAHGTAAALVDGVHLLAAAAWLGTLVQLVAAPASPALALRARRVATAAVVLIVPAGVYTTCLHVASLGDLVSAPYGRALVVKLGFVGVLLVLGARNHFREVPRALAGSAAAERALRRTVRLELAVGALVLLISAWLGVLPMPHAHTRSEAGRSASSSVATASMPR